MISIHPFPARMAPELALSKLENLCPNSVVLDPMVGSGTVVRQAVGLGHKALGFDLDPLAVLVSKVSTTAVDDQEIAEAAVRLTAAARDLDPDEIRLPWLDGDNQGETFVEFWFGEPQRRDLRRLAFLLSNPDSVDLSSNVANILRVALSRIIVTKHQSASLAQDTSHSRPHKVSESSAYNVFGGFEKSVEVLRRRLAPLNHGVAMISRGDARSMQTIADGSIDIVLTSPPYLNAIDYLRGHRMSLIWLGHRLSDLSAARSTSIGSERRPDHPIDQNFFSDVKMAMGDTGALPSRFHGMIDRYVSDLYKMAEEVNRVLKPAGLATFVMGDSCLRGIFIRNSEALAIAAQKAGLTITEKVERDLPPQHRYLPTPKSGALSKRMRKEIILSFTKINTA